MRSHNQVRHQPGAKGSIQIRNLASSAHSKMIYMPGKRTTRRCESDETSRKSGSRKRRFVESLLRSHLREPRFRTVTSVSWTLKFGRKIARFGRERTGAHHEIVDGVFILQNVGVGTLPQAVSTGRFLAASTLRL